MSSSINTLAATITRLDRQVRALSTTPQLAYSSIEDGGSIDSNHDDGTTMATFGGQFDGSFMGASLVGPTPPTPSAPIVTAAIGGLTVRWDGEFTDALFAPMDFTRVEVHVSTVAAFVPNEATTLVATIESPRGALPFIARPIGTYYVAFVARSQSGKAGLKSATVGPRTTDNSLTVNGALIVNGSETVNGPLAVHDTAAFDGNTTIGGNAHITGTLSLPAGIINNAALTNPTKSQAVYASATSFGLTTTDTTRVSSTITVPAGFTAADISVIGRVFAYNSNTTGGGDGAGADYLHATPFIGSVPGISLPLVVAGSGSSGINVAPQARVLTGLTPGGTFTITVKVSSRFQTWAANVDNTVVLSGMIEWSR